MIFVSLYNPTDCHPANYDQDKLLEILHSKINWCNIFEILLYFYAYKMHIHILHLFLLNNR